MQSPRNSPRASSRAKPTPPRAQRARAASPTDGSSAAQRIDQRIRELGDWRGAALERVRALIQRADPAMAEEWKWNVPVWSHDGIVCTGEVYAKVVKLTFARGAGLPDPSHLFNSSLEGKTRRAIDLREGDGLDARAFQALVKAAIAANRRPAEAAARSGRARTPKLLSGSNPQIAKGDGDAPVREYVEALAGWKRAIVERVDALVVRGVPGVRKAVRWNSPFYGRAGGIEGEGWFLALHVFTRYVKLSFFRGAALRPLPPGGTEKSKDARWIDLREGAPIDEQQLLAWVKQAAALPGWDPGRKA
ncbi:MAG: DUF1801 domain-containing protein [Planctomycetes bacterium]|nr:DUF1801 domain-containing protein [Planctomycetota bacterium]